MYVLGVTLIWMSIDLKVSFALNISFLCLRQFSQWVDAVILVFSLDDEISFNTVYTFHSQMAQYRAGLNRDIPIILVGTQDSISEANPRVIDDSRSRLLASELRCCAYYETCATYGLNVERVFHDGQCNRGISYDHPQNAANSLLAYHTNFTIYNSFNKKFTYIHTN